MEKTTRGSADTIEQLNSFLRGELSAVETYRQALEKAERPNVRSTLEQCARSHAQRVQLLKQEVQRHGGQPADSAGLWGTFAKLVEGGAKMLGEKAAIAALEEGEDHGRDDYKRDIDGLDMETRAFVEQKLMPEQLRTHDALSALKKSLS